MPLKPIRKKFLLTRGPVFGHDVRRTARNNTNVKPTANAGENQTVKSGSEVTLYGSGSSDPDYGIPFYSWTQTEGEEVTLNNATTATPYFLAPGSVDEGIKVLTFKLVVTDNGGLTSEDTVDISVEKKDDDGKGCFIRTLSR